MQAAENAAIATAASASAQVASPPPARAAKAAKTIKAPKPAKARPAAKVLEAAKPPAPIKAVKPLKRAKAVKPAKPAAPAKPTAVAVAAAAAHAGKPARTKEKLVRDSFTMPRADFALIQQLKDRMLALQRHTRKSELLRAGLQALAGLGDAPLRRLLDGLPALKAGRPRKAG